jgi:hypothetical protein
MESTRVREKMLAGHSIKFREIARRSPRRALRFAFDDGEVVATQTIETLLAKGLVTLDGAEVRVAEAGA